MSDKRKSEPITYGTVLMIGLQLYQKHKTNEKGRKSDDDKRNWITKSYPINGFVNFLKFGSYTSHVFVVVVAVVIIKIDSYESDKCPINPSIERMTYVVRSSTLAAPHRWNNIENLLGDPWCVTAKRTSSRWLDRCNSFKCIRDIRIGELRNTICCAPIPILVENWSPHAHGAFDHICVMPKCQYFSDENEWQVAGSVDVKIRFFIS